jgi:hypothetical protein
MLKTDALMRPACGMLSSVAWRNLACHPGRETAMSRATWRAVRGMSAYFRARPQCINMQAKQPVAVANRGVRNGYRRGEGLWLPTQNIRRYALRIALLAIIGHGRQIRALCADQLATPQGPVGRGLWSNVTG